MKDKNIVVIGGANIEYIIKSRQDIVQGSKNFVDMEELYGGSGVNYTLRLLNVGENVYPVLFVGDDHAGHQIQQEIASSLITNNPEIRYFIEEKSFFIPSVTTPRSTIIVEGIHRTILTQNLNTQNVFRTFTAERLKKVKSVGAVVIGHVHNDKPQVGSNSEDLSTVFTIEYFKDKQSLIYANFGSSQIAHGFAFWKPYLPSIDILQLNISEIKIFFKLDNEDKAPSLGTIIQMLQTLNLSAVITLDKFGAIGILKGYKDTIFMARPVDLGKNFIDSTGAGDAFCAGMVATLNGNKHIVPSQFKEAMQIARSWAVYACKSFGGANKCPSAEAIETFHEKIIQNNEVLLYHGDRIKDIAALIDITMELHEA